MKCSNCNSKTGKITYLKGQKLCSDCIGNNLSGKWIRKAELEANLYKKDILQPYNKDGTENEDYIKAYGSIKQHKGTSHKYKK